MTIEEINLLLEDYRDAVDKADRLSDKLDRNPLYTKEMVQKVDKARMELEKKIAELKAKRQELMKKPEPTPEPIPEQTPEEPTPEPEKERTEILLSVGISGKNNLLDVKLVQKLLNERKGCKLDTDGICGNLTLTQIIDLQRRIFQNWVVDGRIDPGGKTWKWLKGNAALPKLPPPPPPKPIDPIVTPNPTPIVEPTRQEKFVDILGEFADRHLPYEKEFFEFSWEARKYLPYGFFIEGRIGAYANARLSGQRAQQQVTVTGTATLGCSSELSIGWGTIYEGWFGTKTGLEAKGTMKGVLEADFNIHATLVAQGQTLSGTLSSSANITATLSVNASIKLGYVIGTKEWQTEYYKLGTITFLRATTPAYTMTYNFGVRKFSFSRGGSWRVEVHPSLSNTLKATVKSS